MSQKTVIFEHEGALGRVSSRAQVAMAGKRMDGVAGVAAGRADVLRKGLG